MAKAGRKSKYETHIKPHFKEIHDAIARGVEEKIIAEELGVGSSAWCEYKKKFPEFAELFKRDVEETKELLQKLEGALLKIATGFHYIEEKRIARKDKDGETIVYFETYKKYQPPNTTAIFGAFNRFDPDYVKDKAYYDLKMQELKLKKAIAKDNAFDDLEI